MPSPEFTSTVVVQPLPEQTDPAQQIWAYAYTITVKNTGDIAAQLIGREWLIVDHDGDEQHVRGLGVVGKQPLLQPGEAFSYTSWARIGTPQGTMKGRFFCITEEANWFESEVAEFMLADMGMLH
jgi:ApaG protein